jgi:hypothetical protein
MKTMLIVFLVSLFLSQLSWGQNIKKAPQRQLAASDSSQPKVKLGNSDFFNVQISPIAPLLPRIGIYNFEVGIRPLNNYVFSLDFVTYKGIMTSGTAEGTAQYSSLTLLAKYYLRENNQSSFFVAGGLGAITQDISVKSGFGGTITVGDKTENINGSYSTKTSGTLFQLGFGYHWFWSSFNQHLAIYEVTRSIDQVKINGGPGYGSAGTGQLPWYIDYKIGFTF